MQPFVFPARTTVPLTRLAVLAIAVLAAGCSDPLEPRPRHPPPPDVALQAACAAELGTLHTELRPGSQHFRRQSSPHWVMETLLVTDALTIEAGATVCFAAGVQLQIADSGRMEAQGTPSAPVLLTAMDPAQPWGGIQNPRSTGTPGRLGGDVSLRHARLEHAEIGVAVHSFTLDSTVVRQIRGPAIRTSMRGIATGGYFSPGSGRITGSVVDTACTACVSDGAAVDLNTSSVVIEGTVIRGSGGYGVRALGGKLSLRDVLIHGSAQEGLVMSRAQNPRQSDPAATFEPPVSVRITAGGSHPATIMTALLPDLIPDAAALDRLRGNANDALRLLGGTSRDVVIHAGMPTFLAGDPSSVLGGAADIRAHLQMEAGASLRILAVTYVSSGGRITAEGTADRPVTLAARAIDFRGAPAAPSRIVHALLDSITLNAGESHALVVEDVIGRGSGISSCSTCVLVLSAPGSKVLRSRFDGGTIAVRGPDVVLSDVVVRNARSHGFLIEAPNARLSRCEAAANRGDGIRLTHAAGVQITGCNLFDNAGFAVNNMSADAVDARGNWWGVPDGPFAPGADGVSASVDYEPFRNQPAEVAAPTTRTSASEPRSLTLASLDAAIAVGDTTRLTAAVRNASGELIAEQLEWRSSDRGVAAVDGAGLITGVTTGTATISVVARADTTLRASALVQVNPGAPSYEWTPLDLIAEAIWGSPEAGLFALTGTGVQHYDGTSWTRLEGVPNVRLRGIWGTSATNVWVVGDQRTVIRYDGTAWHHVNPPPSALLRLVWVAGPDQVFVVGRDSSEPHDHVWHYDGTSWREVHTGPLWAIWGRSPTDIFVGSSSYHSALHFDGTTWKDTQAGETLVDFWGTNNEIFGGGITGTVRRYDGERWHTVVNGRPNTFLPTRGIWGSSPTNIFAVGDAGRVRHYDGSQWRTMWLGTESSFSDVWGIGDTVFIIGQQSYMGRPR